MNILQLCVRQNFYIEHDTKKQSTFVSLNAFHTLPDISNHFYEMAFACLFEIPLQDLCLGSKSRCTLSSVFNTLTHQAAEIFSLKVKEFFSVAFKPSTNSLPCLGDPTPQSMIIFYVCANMDSKYRAVAHLYFLAQPSVLSKMELR